MLQQDLTTCDTEPIHIPGRVQGHGFLIGINDLFQIAYCSENIRDFLPVSAADLLGQPTEKLEGLFENQQYLGFIRQLILFSTKRKAFEPANPYEIELAGQLFNVIASKSGDFYLLEFEPELSGLKSNLQQLVGRSLSEMLSDKSLSRLLANTADQIRQIIAYDRVMFYKFHPDGHGEVVAEAKSEELETWLGLHYPASDIPVQARELYKRNLTRLIADVEQDPADILTVAENLHAAPLDLTCSTLRAVSPVHIQYLKNMGVASSFSVSILNNNELWGLIACHNYTPKFINYKERESAKLIGQVLSSAFSFRQQEDDSKLEQKFSKATEAITRSLLRDIPVEQALMRSEVTIQDALASGGAALLFENKLTTIGQVLPEPFLLRLIDWAAQHMENDVFQTSRLPDVLPEAILFKSIASGALVCRLSKDLKEYMVWIRPEVITTVTWAGDPNKAKEYDQNNILHISPRTSFKAWSEKVNNTSIEWTQQDIKVVQQLKDEVNYTISRKATELRVLNEKLREAYAELDTFSYTISHDLKNPLSIIKSYSQMITGRFELDPKVKSMMKHIEQGADKMQEMITEILNYSRAGQAKITLKAINMQKLLEDLRRDLLIASANPELELKIGNAPEILGDEMMVFQVFSNLLGNAVKYSQRTPCPVVVINGEVLDNEVRYKISDNGIGIAEADQDKIFELFSRAEGVKSFEGSGVGLAIVKRILEKHHGRIWVESTPGKGSDFFVSFKHYEAAKQLN